MYISCIETSHAGKEQLVQVAVYLLSIFTCSDVTDSFPTRDASTARFGTPDSVTHGRSRTRPQYLHVSMSLTVLLFQIKRVTMLQTVAC